jgi:integrase/recombinase XerD
MSTTTLSPLRQRMIEDMSLRNLAPRTQEAYIRGCRKLAAFLRRSPDTATAEDIRLFQLHLAEQGVSICTRNRTMTGIVFLFRVTLRRPEIADQIEYIAEPQKIPLVLSPEEVRRLLDAAPGFKYRLLLSLTYGCGLRASEVVSLKVSDIDSAQMVIRIERRRRRHVQMQGLPDRWTGPVHDDDAAPSRVHPALLDARPAERAPSHPPLWASRQWQSRRQHRARPRAARHGATRQGT